MSRYIKREDAIKAVAEYTKDCFGIFEDAILNAEDVVLDSVPSVDVIEPKRGEWIEHEGKTIVMDNNFVDFFPTEYEWSNCGLRQATYFINSSLPNYCPNCGADMRKESE